MSEFKEALVDGAIERREEMVKVGDEAVADADGRAIVDAGPAGLVEAVLRRALIATAANVDSIKQKVAAQIRREAKAIAKEDATAVEPINMKQEQQIRDAIKKEKSGDG